MRDDGKVDVFLTGHVRPEVSNIWLQSSADGEEWETSSAIIRPSDLGNLWLIADPAEDGPVRFYRLIATTDSQMP